MDTNSSGGDMPRGAMTDASVGALGGAPLSEMPAATMTAGSASMGEAAAGEMPRGDMGGGQPGSMSGGGGSGGEMPTGAMGESAGTGNLQVIEIPGSWRLTLSRISS